MTGAQGRLRDDIPLGAGRGRARRRIEACAYAAAQQPMAVRCAFSTIMAEMATLTGDWHFTSLR